MQHSSSGVRWGLSLLFYALSRALHGLEMVFCFYPTRLPLVSRRSQAARRFAPMPLALASSHPPGVFARSTSPFTHRKARLRAEQRFRPSKSCPPDMRSTTKPPLRTPSFLPFFGKKGRPARRGHVPPPPSGGVPSSSPVASKPSSCRRSGKIAFGNFILGITSFLPAFDAKSGIKAQGLRPLTRGATARCNILLPASFAERLYFSSRLAALCPALGQPLRLPDPPAARVTRA